MNSAKSTEKMLIINKMITMRHFFAFHTILVAERAAQKKNHPKTLNNTCNMSARQIKPVQKLYTEINEACVNKNRTSAHSHEPPLSFIAGVHSVPLFLIDLIN